MFSEFLLLQTRPPSPRSHGYGTAALPPLLGDRPSRAEAEAEAETDGPEAPYTLDAFRFGNVARYINHDSLSPARPWASTPSRRPTPRLNAFSTAKLPDRFPFFFDLPVIWTVPQSSLPLFPGVSHHQW